MKYRHEIIYSRFIEGVKLYLIICTVYTEGAHIIIVNYILLVDPCVHLGDLNKRIGEQWQEEREEFNQIASVEPTRDATLKDFLNHLAKLVCLTFSSRSFTH